MKARAAARMAERKVFLKAGRSAGLALAGLSAAVGLLVQEDPDLAPAAKRARTRAQNKAALEQAARARERNRQRVNPGKMGWAARKAREQEEWHKRATDPHPAPQVLRAGPQATIQRVPQATPARRKRAAQRG